jgi:hypothetical protein
MSPPRKFWLSSGARRDPALSSSLLISATVVGLQTVIENIPGIVFTILNDEIVVSKMSIKSF